MGYWLVTGASSGLGKALALQVLKAGHKVIGTTRNVGIAEESCPDFKANGGIWVKLDPGQNTAGDEFRTLSQEYDIDVLVNNAGYAFVGGVEDTSEEELRQQMEVNFYGPLRAVRACLPRMRENGKGHIVIMSSGAGFMAKPGRSSYSASKFAIEAIHESLVDEVKSFGIKVLIVEPGPFRTPFATNVLTPAIYESGFSDPYRNTIVEQMVNRTRNVTDIPDFVKGDPDKAALAVLQAVESGGHDYLRLLLGPGSVQALATKIDWLTKDLNSTRAIAMSTDVCSA